MSAQEPKEVKVEIRLPKDAYPKTMFFNRFQVEHEDGFCIVHFVLVSKSGLLLDAYSCVLPRRTLEHHKVGLLDYHGRIAQTDEEKPFLWQGGKIGANADVADIITMSFHNDMAETCFSVFSMMAASQQRRSSAEPLTAQPLALLRSPVGLQKQFIEKLYE